MFNPYWGVSITHDELSLDDSREHSFHRRMTVGLGYNPLGDNRGKPWNLTIEPSVFNERIHRFRPAPGGISSGLGYSIGPVYHYGLDQVRLARLVGPGKRLRMDRFKVRMAIADSEVADFTLLAGVNVTAYATRFLKLLSGAETRYWPAIGRWEFSLNMGASFRIGWTDLRL